MSTTLTVSVVGTSVSAMVDGRGNFTLTNVPAGDVTLSFSGTGVNARITITGVSEHEQIRLTVNVHGTTAELDENERENNDSRAEIEGTIVSINASARTLVVGRHQTTVSVPTGIPIHHGRAALAFSGLVVGDRARIHATRNGATLTATDIEVQTDHQGEIEETELDGKISSVSGTCPAPTFVVKGTTVTTNTSTTFSDGGCTGIVVGAQVEVKGLRQASGSVLATRVKIEVKIEIDEAEVEGQVSTLSGSCPNLTLTVHGTTVVTNSATQFGRACGTINVGASVDVKGTRQPNRSILATRINVDN
jgi:hypothetical protein